jgi:hypothetical protein
MAAKLTTTRFTSRERQGAKGAKRVWGVEVANKNKNGAPAREETPGEQEAKGKWDRQ